MEVYVIIIADIIKKCRLNIGYTQRQVADLLGIDRSTYCCYEIGRIHPDLNTIMKLASIFKVHYTELLESEQGGCLRGGERLSDSGGIYDNELRFGNLSDEEKYFIVAFRLLPEDSRKEVMNMILDKFKHRNDAGNLQNGGKLGG